MTDRLTAHMPPTAADLLDAHNMPDLDDLAPAPDGHGDDVGAEDWAAYCATAEMFSDTWTGGLDFDHTTGNEDDDLERGGYGPYGQHTAGEWLLLGARMAHNWEDAFALMHRPPATATAVIAGLPVVRGVEAR